MEAHLLCGSCRHLKDYIDHPKYGTIEIDFKRNAELFAKLFDELWKESHTIPYASCELHYLETARKRLEHGWNCDRFDSRTRHCRICGAIIDTGF